MRIGASAAGSGRHERDRREVLLTELREDASFAKRLAHELAPYLQRHDHELLDGR